MEIVRSEQHNEPENFAPGLINRILQMVHESMRFDEDMSVCEPHEPEAFFTSGNRFVLNLDKGGYDLLTEEVRHRFNPTPPFADTVAYEPEPVDPNEEQYHDLVLSDSQMDYLGAIFKHYTNSVKIDTEELEKLNGLLESLYG